MRLTLITAQEDVDEGMPELININEAMQDEPSAKFDPDIVMKLPA